MLLSAPKGSHYKCELCGKPASIVCPQCKCTYYCSKEHQSVDWNGVHVKVCPYLAILRSPEKVLGSEEARSSYLADRLATQRVVIEIGKTEATRALLSQKFDHAIPGALQALRVTTDLFGEGGIEIVPPYLLLAQATTGLKKYKQAEEYLSLAKWSVLKHPTCSDALKSQLYRNFGTLYTSQGKHDTALHHFGNSVYYSSLAMGPEHIDTTPGYYQMGLIFHEQGQLESALAMLDKVADTWYKYLSKETPKKSGDGEDNEDEGALASSGHQAAAAAASAAAAATSRKDSKKPAITLSALSAELSQEANTAENVGNAAELEELKGTEASEMLEKIISIREQHLGTSHTATGEAFYILALILAKLGLVERALEKMQRALAIYEDTLGGDHATTQSVRTALSSLEQIYFQG